MMLIILRSPMMLVIGSVDLSLFISSALNTLLRSAARATSLSTDMLVNWLDKLPSCLGSINLNQDLYG